MFLILTDKVYGVTIFESRLKKKRGRNKMNCLRCGESVPDDAIFCSKCGSRVDGKKNCVRCGKSIDEGNNKYALAFAIVNTVMFIAYLVLNVVIVNSFEKSDLLTSSSEIDLGGTAIAGLILSFLALVAIIINLALAKKVKSVSVDLPAENA